MDPTLMYSNPVADSIDRDRAVWTDAQQTISGKISPTMRRSQTNSAHGPTSDENGATSAGPAPVPTQATKSTTWTTTMTSKARARRMSGASGSFGVTRYQWPRIIAANTPPMAALTTTSWTSNGTAPGDPPPHARAPNSSVATAARSAPHSTAWATRAPARRATSEPAAMMQNSSSATWRGPSQAG